MACYPLHKLCRAHSWCAARSAGLPQGDRHLRVLELWGRPGNARHSRARPDPATSLRSKDMVAGGCPARNRVKLGAVHAGARRGARPDGADERRDAPGRGDQGRSRPARRESGSSSFPLAAPYVATLPDQPTRARTPPDPPSGRMPRDEPGYDGLAPVKGAAAPHPASCRARPPDSVLVLAARHGAGSRPSNGRVRRPSLGGARSLRRDWPSACP